MFIDLFAKTILIVEGPEFQGTQTLIPVDHILAASSHGVWSSFRP